MKALASSLNSELRILREKRQKYVSGDAKLKKEVTNISHDLRTPLTAICGYLDLLQREEHTENSKKYLSVIRERTDSMRNLTEELFKYSVVASETEGLKPEKVSPSFRVRWRHGKQSKHWYETEPCGQMLLHQSAEY